MTGPIMLAMQRELSGPPMGRAEPGAQGMQQGLYGAPQQIGLIGVREQFEVLVEVCWRAKRKAWFGVQPQGRIEVSQQAWPETAAQARSGECEQSAQIADAHGRERSAVRGRTG
jgi:hypothetical protein